MSVCCILVAFVIFILFSSSNNPVPNTEHVAFGGIGRDEVDSRVTSWIKYPEGDTCP